ncbi:MAG: DNA starvation/stationary phase protection protein Dps [Chloroflexi bacterium]|nr:DNA starvation/stationary phase protection protein Dps [Chloroflexota bacterium]
METRTSKLHASRIDLPADAREQLVTLLNQHLADLADLHSQTKQAHWNVKGMDFIALHELFDELAAGILVFVDDVAERVTALGGDAMGTVRMAADNSRLVEFPSEISEGRAFVEALAERYADYGTFARMDIKTAEEAGDMDTADLFTEISRQIDKNLYFLEAHLR